MKLLVIACPRSGTGWTAEALLKLGLNVSHEKDGKHGDVDWQRAVRTEGYDIVLHQVRHPLLCISSMAFTIKDRSRDYIREHLNILHDMSNLELAMHTWVEWNKLCEEKSLLTYTIENASRMMPDMPNTINARHHDHLSWKDLYDEDKTLTKKISLLAEHYGYEGCPLDV